MGFLRAFLVFTSMALVAGAFAAENTQPAGVGDLRALQDKIREVAAKVTPCTVGIAMQGSMGSGVIVSKDGYVLTAGHVCGQPGLDCKVILPDGTRLKAKTLGVNPSIDSGLIKITEEGEWPHLEMGSSSDLTLGQWCLALGHPGGYRSGRPPVVRCGRVLGIRSNAVQTDCTLVGGDSGGPLFDLQGRVVGINSSISKSYSHNIHVPVDTFRNTWDRLTAGKTFNDNNPPADSAYLGVSGQGSGGGVKVTQVYDGTPASEAGIESGDVLLSFDGHKVAGFGQLVGQVSRKKPGDEVEVEVRRGKENMKFKITLGKRSQ